MDYTTVLIIVVGVVAYWRGFISGTEYNVGQKVRAVLKHLPVNVSITEEGGVFFAHFLHNREFLAQDGDYSALMQKLAGMFPDKAIVVALKDTV